MEVNTGLEPGLSPRTVLKEQEEFNIHILPVGWHSLKSDDFQL